MVWGWPDQSTRANGGWIDYGNGKGRGGSNAGGWRRERSWQNRVGGGSGGAKDARQGKESIPAFLKAWTSKNDKQMAAMMQKVAGVHVGEPAKAQDAKKKATWECQCGFSNFGFRTECMKCERPMSGPSPVGGGAQAPAGMEVDGGAAKVAPPEEVVKDLKNILSHCKDTSPGSLVVIDLKKKLQAAEEEIRQNKPPHVRLQTAMKKRDTRAALFQTSEEGLEKSRLSHEARIASHAGVKAALDESEEEVNAIQVELGRPQMEAGATAAVQLCVGMLQQHGMTAEVTAQFMEVLRCAFGAGPVRAAAPIGASPFVVKIEAASAAAATPASGPGMAALFSAGGGFPSQGASAFPVGPSQEEMAETARLAEAQQQEWEQSRSEAVTSLKQRLEIQRLKHGAVSGQLAGALDAAKKAKEAGGGDEETEKAEQLALEVQSEQNLIDSMESQRQSLESEAFSKATTLKPTRASPF